MEFNSPSSLKFHSAVAVTESLFYHEDLRLLKHRQEHKFGWVSVQNHVAKYTTLLPLPDSLQKDLLFLVQPLGDQIRKWMCRHDTVVLGDEDLYRQMSWSTHGIIDYAQTARNLLERRRMDDCAAFYLACINASERHIRELWPKVKSRLQPLINRSLKSRHVHDYSYPEEARMWGAWLTDQTDKYLRSRHATDVAFEMHAFRKAVEVGNTASARFFLSRLDPSARVGTVQQTAAHVLSYGRSFSSATLLFLLSEMGEGEREQFFLRHAENAFFRFLEWPLQKHFVALARRVWRSRPPPRSVFPAAVEAVVQRIKQHDIVPESISFATPQLYEDIFHEFWRSSPDECKAAYVRELLVPVVSCIFSPHGYDSGMSQLFVSDSEVEEKLLVLFLSTPGAVLQLLLNENKSKAFKSLIQKFLPPWVTVPDFEQLYETLTSRYQDVYYGNVMLPD